MPPSPTALATASSAAAPSPQVQFVSVRATGERRRPHELRRRASAKSSSDVCERQHALYAIDGGCVRDRVPLKLRKRLISTNSSVQGRADFPMLFVKGQAACNSGCSF